MGVVKIPCTCPCHQPGNMMMHIQACCNNGFIEQFIQEEEKKYYTPEVEEFYVGFECEKVIPHSDGGHQISLTNIEQKPFVIKDVFHIPSNEAECSWFRVKYLDKEDIESLEWNQIEYDTYQYKNEDFYLEFNPEYKTIIYSKMLGHWLFSGDIKNKSELSKLMKQLKIMK